MMLALPTQKLRDVKKMAKFLVKKDIKHISPYSLILEPTTALYKQVKSGRVSLPSEDDSVEMYNYVFKYLSKKGYHRYEVSNFSQPDYESKHNLNYWQMGEYVAFGLAGHSYLNNYRFANTDNFEEYIETVKSGKLPVVSIEGVNEKTQNLAAEAEQMTSNVEVVLNSVNDIKKQLKGLRKV